MAPSFLKSTLVILTAMLLWMAVFFAASFRQRSSQPNQPCTTAFVILGQPFSLFASISKKRFNIERKRAITLVRKGEKLWHICQSLAQQIRKIWHSNFLPKFLKKARRRKAVWWPGLYGIRGKMVLTVSSGSELVMVRQ